MRALRSRSVKSDSGSIKSDTEKAIKKGKRNKKLKKTSKRKTEISTDVSTENDIFAESLDSIEHKAEQIENKTEHQTENKTEHQTENETVNKTGNKKGNKKEHKKKHKKTRLTEDVSSDVPKSRRTTRHSTMIVKDVLKENISPNIKSYDSGTDLFEESPQQQHPKNKRQKKGESLEFENVTSTVKKTRKTTNSNKVQPQTRISKKSANISQNFEVTDITTTQSKTINKTRSSLSSTFEKSHNSQDYSPTFKNIVTSTTIKPKKPKQINDTNSNERQISDNKLSNILLENTNISDENQKNTTDALNSTYIKIDDVSASILTSTNNSGQWNIEEQKSVINISDDTKMLESHLNEEVFTSPANTNKDMKRVFFQDKSLSKSARKKWQRFPRNSQGANSVLEQISTPQKKSPPNKSFNISQKFNKTANTTTTTQSANKIKRTAMPNFALIHQKAYEKMESISEYSQRKKNRANLLLSNKKIAKENETESKMKSSRQLFTNEKADMTKLKFNRFGFKLKPNSNPITSKSVEVPQKLEKPLKPPICDREDVLAIANKKVQNTGKHRENKRDLLKGVRTNRRFELLMKMRNN